MEETLTQLWADVVTFLTGERILSLVRGMLLLAVGLIIARVASRAVSRIAARRTSAQQTMILTRGVYYGILGLVAASVLRHLGFDLSVFLGAAGLLTVAIGFASQTSASNLISGIFLLGEQPFVVGEVIQVEDTTGEVLSIDWLSVKLRTFDNLLVRLPNETLLKSQIINLTRFPIRRMDFPLGVAYKEDVARVREVLFEVAERHPRCLDEPRPALFFLSFGDSAQNLQFSAWARREGYADVKTEMYIEIKRAFDAAGIEIPFPHMSVIGGGVGEPFPMQRAADAAPDASDNGDSGKAS